LSVRDQIGETKTAFVFAGGGSFGAIQVGMLQSLAAHGITPDMVVGSSVGALNGAFYAGDPTLKGVERLATIWRGLTRQDVFPMSWRTVLSFLWHRDFLIPHDGIRKLIDDNIPYRNLQDAKLPVHIVTTDIISGDSVVLSEGSTAEAIVASTAIPGAFTPVRYKDYYLADGAISSNTPIQVAVRKGARRLIILPTGHACATQAPPIGAVANALHALTLLIARQLVSELENLGPVLN
jgi:NTE family protein